MCFLNFGPSVRNCMFFVFGACNLIWNVGNILSHFQVGNGVVYICIYIYISPMSRCVCVCLFVCFFFFVCLVWRRTGLLLGLSFGFEWLTFSFSFVSIVLLLLFFSCFLQILDSGMSLFLKMISVLFPLILYYLFEGLLKVYKMRDFIFFPLFWV